MKQTDLFPILQQMTLFHNVNEGLLSDLAAGSMLHVLSKHQYVYVPGDTSSDLYILLKGTIKIGSYSTDYKEIIRDILPAGSIFGELAILSNEERDSFAMTMSPENTIIAINKTLIHKTLLHDTTLQMQILSTIGSRLRKAERRADDLIYKDAKTRILEYLKKAVLSQGKRIGFEHYLKHGLTQQDIASITGTSRQTVTSVLNELKKSNSIYFTRKSILIRDINNLQLASHH